jgi:hypothetical protein
MKTLQTKSEQELVAMRIQALENPSGYVYEIDGPHREHDAVHTSAIKGGWEVDENGLLTGRFEENENYREIITFQTPPEYMQKMQDERHYNNFLYAGQWFPETSMDYAHLFPQIPEEGFVGRWYIDANGCFNGWFRPNPYYKGNIKT